MRQSRLFGIREVHKEGPEHEPAPELREQAREFIRGAIIHDLSTSVRIVQWAYTQTFECHGLTWVRRDELQPHPANWDSTLQRLLN